MIKWDEMWFVMVWCPACIPRVLLLFVVSGVKALQDFFHNKDNDKGPFADFVRTDFSILDYLLFKIHCICDNTTDCRLIGNFF